jgi:hypothetical protein
VRINFHPVFLIDKMKDFFWVPYGSLHSTNSTNFWPENIGAFRLRKFKVGKIGVDEVSLFPHRMRGTPTLGPRGGYKLFVKLGKADPVSVELEQKPVFLRKCDGISGHLGEGHSITKEVLEGAFAAHGNVTDAYVPDGKAFGFVTYGTQEEAEKGGEALNGG